MLPIYHMCGRTGYLMVTVVSALTGEPETGVQETTKVVAVESGEDVALPSDLPFVMRVPPLVESVQVFVEGTLAQKSVV